MQKAKVDTQVPLSVSRDFATRFLLTGFAAAVLYVKMIQSSEWGIKM